MIYAKQEFRKYLFFAFKDFMLGINVNNTKDRYNFLKPFVKKYEANGVTPSGVVYKKGDSWPCFFNTNDIEWSSEELAEAIDLFFYIFSKDQSEINHIKNLISIGTQSPNNDEDYRKFCGCLLYGDKICIKIAQTFGIEEPIREDGRVSTFDDWIKAIKNAFGDNKLKYYSNVLYLGKVIRNLNAHEWEQKIDRLNWVLTIQFLLHSYIGLCLLLTKIKGNPMAADSDFMVSLAEDVIICTNNRIKLKVKDVNNNYIYTDVTYECTRKVRLERCKKYNIVIDDGAQNFEIELIATANNVTISIDCNLNTCNVIYNSRNAMNVQQEDQVIINEYNTDANKWSTMAEIINAIYRSGILMYIRYSSFDRSTLLEILHGPDIPCTGELHRYTKDFGKYLIDLSKVLEGIIRSEDAYNLYISRLNDFESKVSLLRHNMNDLDMSNIAGIVNVLSAVGNELYTNTPVKRLIFAGAYTGAGRCNNMNVNAFFFMGNIICPIEDMPQIINLGAAILHDLYKVLPDSCKRMVDRDYESALKCAETDYDLYHIRINL